MDGVDGTVDWISVYLLLVEFGITDPMFNLLNIQKLPMQFIGEISKKTSEGLRQRRNTEALATAHLGVLVHSLGLMMSDGGDKYQRLSEHDFVPYPRSLPKDSSKPILKPSTIATLKWLFKNDSIGRKIFTLASKFISNN